MKKFVVCMAVFFAMSAARAMDSARMMEEFADMKAKIAALEAAQAPAAKAPGDAESLMSMKKKGAIKIGGKIELFAQVVDRDDRLQTDARAGGNAMNARTGEDDEVLSTTFMASNCDLTFDIAATKDMGAFILLDCADFWDAGVGQDDLLEECYFYFKNILGSSFSINFGKKEAPFGQDKDPLINTPYTNNSGRMTFLGSAWEANDPDRDANSRSTSWPNHTNTNPHAAVGDFSHPGEIDNVFMIEATYKHKDLLKLEMAVYQSSATEGAGNTARTGNGRNTRGMFEDRPDDSLFFQSVCGRLTITPIEGLSIQLSGLNAHNETYGDKDYMGRAAALTLNSIADTRGTQWADNDGDGENDYNDAEDDRQAISAGFTYKFKPIPLEIWAEYLHGWNWTWNDRYNTDQVSVGACYGVTENLDFYLISEWLGIDDDRVRDYEQDEDYWKITTALTYKLEGGIMLSLEYVHEWYDLDWNRNGTQGLARPRVEDAEADAVLFGTMWKF